MQCYLCGKKLQNGVCELCGQIDIQPFRDFAPALLTLNEIKFIYSFDPANFNCLGRQVKGRVKLIFLQKRNGETMPMIRIYTKGKMEIISLLKVKIEPGNPLEPLLEFVKQQNFSQPAPVKYPLFDGEAEKVINRPGDFSVLYQSAATQ
jgi:hypothetical protein